MDTSYNFYRSIPFVIVLVAVFVQSTHLSAQGIILAVLSGGIASGIGYTIWYIALAGLTATQAAVLQLLVPVIAAIGGVIFVSEAITLRLVLAAALVLGGISIVLFGKYYFVQRYKA